MVDVVRPIIFLYQSNNIEAHVKWQIVMADIGIGGIDDTPALSPRYRFFGTQYSTDVRVLTSTTTKTPSL